VKLEKIDILVKVAEEKNVEVILAELREYAGDLEAELIKKSVRAIGQIILKVDKGAKKAVEIISDIVSQGNEIGVEEAVIVAKDIFRKFPNKFESLIKDLVSKLEMYRVPESKASIIWVIGEYAEQIPDSEKLIESFIEMFLEEHDKVKLSILTAAVKLYLKKPDEGEEII
jgi:vesicle coat complex subunit